MEDQQICTSTFTGTERVTGGNPAAPTMRSINTPTSTGSPFEMKYALPDNLVHLECHYMHEFPAPPAVARPCWQAMRAMTSAKTTLLMIPEKTSHMVSAFWVSLK